MSTRFRTIIRVFVSSTFGDLQKERNLLQADVFPALERYCAEREFQFQAIDLRWGVPGEAALDHRTMRICFDELRRSQQISPKPNFLVLLGDRYGWQPLPEEISEKEHAELEANSPKVVSNAREVLAQWYRRDENAVPPVYLLRSRHELPDGRDYANPQKDNPSWKAVQQLLWAVITQAYPAIDRANRFAHTPKLSEPLPSIAKFQASATEQEIWLGALAVKDASEHVVAWFRDIREPEQYRIDKRAEDFFDHEFFQGDDAPRQAARELREALERKLGKVISPVPVSLRESASKQRLEVTDDHLPEMCCYIQDELTRLIDQEISEYWKLQRPIASKPRQKEDLAAQAPDLPINLLELRKLELEQQAHERFGTEREANFVGREQELAAIKKYLDDEDRKPLVVYGPSGTGKTALLARAATLAESGNHKVITRYLGITPRSSTLRDLLVNLCCELREPSTAPQSLPTDMTAALQAEFDRLQIAAGRRQPVALFIDALDQLDPADNAHGTYWLRSPLPPGIKTVVSCLWDPDLGQSSTEDDNGATNTPSREASTVNQPYLSLQGRQLVDRAIAVESLTAKQARELLERWLTNRDVGRTEKRKLTAAQWKAIEERIGPPGATACRRPMYLRVLFEECRQWPSWKKVVSEELGEDTSAQLRRLLHRLSEPSVHGRELVSAALGYLVAARRGLSENELLEVLRADPEYKTHLERASAEFHHELPRDAKRIPVALWSRLRFDLDPYVSEQAAPGATVVHFYHRPVAQVVMEEFLPDLNCKDDVRQRLAEHFGTGSLSDLYSAFLTVDAFAHLQNRNMRQADELPWLLLQLKSWKRLYEYLSFPDILRQLWDWDPHGCLRYWSAIEGETPYRLVNAYSQVLQSQSEYADLLPVLLHLMLQMGYRAETVVPSELHLENIRKQPATTQQLIDALNLRALALQSVGDLNGARLLFEEILNCADHAEEALGKVLALGNLAALLAQNDPPGALAYLEKEEALLRTLGCPTLPDVLGNKAIILSALGRSAEAMKLFCEAENYCQAVGDKDELSRNWLNHARHTQLEGDYLAAAKLYDKAEGLCRCLGANERLLRVICGRADMLFEQHHYDQCLAVSLAQETWARKLGIIKALIKSLEMQGLIWKNKGDLRRALRCFRAQESHCNETGDQASLGACLSNQANVFRRKRQFSRARDLLKRAEQISKATNNNELLVNVLSNQAFMYEELKRPQDALLALERAHHIAIENGLGKLAARLQCEIEEFHDPVTDWPQI